jgi:hypothetical protein
LFCSKEDDACRGSMHRCTSRADRLDVYLRDAQAYMLISMPTGTSTIFGVFQLIHSSQGLPIKDLQRSLARMSRRD